MAQTRAQTNRAIRQEQLRELLQKKGLIEKVIDIAQKLEEPADPEKPIDVQALKASADIRLKLIDKFLPALKAVEHTGEGGSELPTITIKYE